MIARFVIECGDDTVILNEPLSVLTQITLMAYGPTGELFWLVVDATFGAALEVSKVLSPMKKIDAILKPTDVPVGALVMIPYVDENPDTLREYRAGKLNNLITYIMRNHGVTDYKLPRT